MQKVSYVKSITEHDVASKKNFFFKKSIIATLILALQIMGIKVKCSILSVLCFWWQYNLIE